MISRLGLRLLGVLALCAGLSMTGVGAYHLFRNLPYQPASQQREIEEGQLEKISQKISESGRNLGGDLALYMGGVLAMATGFHIITNTRREDYYE